MPRAKQGDRVIGIYGCRLVTHRRGKRCSDTFGSEEEAQAEAEKLRAVFSREHVTVASARDLWFQEVKLSAATKLRYEYGISEICPDLTLPVSALTPAKCKALHEACCKRYPSGATQRTAIDAMKLLLRWCIGKGYLAKNPMETLKPKTSPVKGKEQLTLDEARKLYGMVMGFAQDPTHPHREKAILIVASVLLGTRIRELTRRVVRDLDDGGRVLAIPFGKSKNAKRRLALPEELQPLFAAQAKGKTPMAPLFTTLPEVVWYWLKKRWCAEAGVPPVCTHSLRGSHATFAVAEGQTGSVVARALGQKSFTQITVPHYLSPGTQESAQAARVTPMITQKE